MSDASQGPGWWQASDGKWYPPQDVTAPPAAAPQPPPAAPPDQPPAPGWYKASDGNWYPPQGQVPPPQPGMAPGVAGAPAAPPSSGMSGCLKVGLVLLGLLVVGGIVAVFLIGFAVNRAADKVDSSTFGEGTSDNPAEDDVKIVTCTDSGESGAPEVTVKVTNHSSKRSDYIIELNLLDGNGDKVSGAFGGASNLSEDQSTTSDLAVDSTVSFDDCEIADVTRFATTSN